MHEARLEVTDALGRRVVPIAKTPFEIGRRETNARGTSPHRSWGMPTTAASSTDGWLVSTCSTWTEEMFSPPLMIRSFFRSTIVT